jgi:hypothetical protein
VGLERCPLGLLRIIDVLRSRKPNKRPGGSVALTTRHPLYPQKLGPSSPRSGGRSVGIVRLRTKGHGVSLWDVNRQTQFRLQLGKELREFRLPN